MNKELFDQLHSNHVRLWDWMAKTGSVHKEDWPEWECNGGKMYLSLEAKLTECFACEAAMMMIEHMKGRCQYCPITWGPDDANCEIASESPYLKWLHCTNEKDRQKYAAIIRDLPWGVK